MDLIDPAACTSTVPGEATLESLPVGVEIVGPESPGRAEYERFIQGVFAATHQARITQFMPQLMGLRASDRGLLAALGMRRAGEAHLFLETYLAAPVEAVLNQALAPFAPDIRREQLVEVGNLAAVHAGGSRWLIVALTAYLQGAGYDWAVFTALPPLRNSFRRLGLKLIPLALAPKACLPPEAQAAWGRYYDGAPQVMAANVPHTYGVLEKYLRLERALQMLQRLWRHAYAAGAARLHPPSPPVQRRATP